MQMSPQRLESSRRCALPYFAADTMLHAYIDSRISFCENSQTNSVLPAHTPLLGPSRISCLPLHVMAQLDQPTLCEAHSVALQLPLLLGTGELSPWLHLPHGALVGSCSRRRNMPPKVLTHCLHDWFEHAFIESSNVTCDEWVEQDTYMVTRHDALNAWYVTPFSHCFS